MRNAVSVCIERGQSLSPPGTFYATHNVNSVTELSLTDGRVISVAASTPGYTPKVGPMQNAGDDDLQFSPDRRDHL
jgi:hypothetical protein